MSEKRGAFLLHPIVILIYIILFGLAIYFFIFKTDIVIPPCKIFEPFSCDEVGFKVINNSVRAVLLNLTYGGGGYGADLLSIKPKDGELLLAGCVYNKTVRINFGKQQQYVLNCKVPLQPTKIDSDFAVEFDKLDIGEQPLGIPHAIKGHLRIISLAVVIDKANQTNAVKFKYLRAEDRYVE